MALGDVIARLSVSLDMNTAAFERGAAAAEARTRAMETRMDKFGRTMKGVGAAIGASFVADAVVGIASNAFQMASALEEAAAKTGTTVEALQELRFAAEQNGVSGDQMDAMLVRLNKSLGELQFGSKGASEAFARIGLSADELKGKAPDQALRLIADEINKLPTAQERVAAGSAIMGRNFAALLPLLNDGAAGLDRFAEASRKQGQISTEDAAKLGELADRWDAFKTRLGVVAANIIADTIPALQKMGSTLDDVAAKSRKAGEDMRDAFDKSVGPIRISTGGIHGAIATMAANIGVELARMVRTADAKLNEFAAKMREIGRQARDGLARGIRENPGVVSGAVGQVVSAAVMEARRRLEIRSPSRVFMQIGDYIGQGLAVGMEGTRGRVAAAAAGMTEAARAAAQETAALLNRLFPEIERANKYRRELGLIDGSSLSDGDKSEARRRLAYEVEGIEGGAEIKALAQGPIATLERATTQLAERTQVATVRVGQSFKDMAEKTMSSLQGLIGAIKGGGFLDILQGLVGFAMQLGSMGVFGSKIATRLNTIPKLANGTNYHRGGLALVGERGPELVTMPRGTRVTPNNELGRLGGGIAQIVPSPYFDVVVDGRVMRAAPAIASGGAALAGQQAAFHRSRRLA